MLERRMQQVKISGSQIPFLHPDQPYTYLGVDFTASLNWKHQVLKLATEIKCKGNKLLNSMISPKQKLQYIESNIRTYVQYALVIGCYTPMEIQKFDALLTRIAKKALDLPQSTPSALIMLERAKGGVGVESNMVNYVQVCTTNLVNAFNDEDVLGQAFRAMWRAEQAIFGKFRSTHINEKNAALLRLTRNLHITNRMSLMKSAGVGIMNPKGQMIELEEEPASERNAKSTMHARQ